MVLYFEDDDVLVINKPAGVLSVPGRGADKQDCVLSRLHDSGHSALVVHRLDTATSGLMVFAKHLPAQRALSHAFATRQTHKLYEAVVEGHPIGHITHLASEQGIQPTSGDEWNSIEASLIIDWPNRPMSKVCEQTGKAALTRWQVITPSQTDANHTRLRLQPVTGRTHQLRVHLMHIGHPIVGDALYNQAYQHLTNEGEQAPARLQLHATHLKVPRMQGEGAFQWHCPAPF